MDVNENVIKYQNIECHSYLESYLAYMVWISRRVNFLFIIFLFSYWVGEIWRYVRLFLYLVVTCPGYDEVTIFNHEISAIRNHAISARQWILRLPHFYTIFHYDYAFQYRLGQSKKKIIKKKPKHQAWY